MTPSLPIASPRRTLAVLASLLAFVLAAPPAAPANGGCQGKLCGDLDGNGNTGAADALRLLKCAVGQDILLECGGAPPAGSLVLAPVDEHLDKDYEEAQAAAPRIPLFTSGQLTVYGKCFLSAAGEQFAVAYVETSAAGSILAANDTVDPAPSEPGGPGPKKALNPWLDGDPDFLDPDTPESDRAIGRASRGAGSFQLADLVRVSFTAASPEGSAINGVMSIGAGRGGLYGDDAGACLFTGFGNG